MSAQTITVRQGEGDQRLDRWLKRHFPHVNQGRVEKACRTGEIRVDGGRVKASTRVEVGQQVRVPPLPEVEPKEKEAIPRVSPADAAMIQACVLYRDDDMIVLNKPPGLASQGGSGTTKHVDGLAEVVSVRPEGGSVRVTFRVPGALARFIAPKGSVALKISQGIVGCSSATNHSKGMPNVRVPWSA